MKLDVYQEILKAAHDHYWDSLEDDKQIVIAHICKILEGRYKEMGEVQEIKSPTARDQINNLHALLTEALASAARIVGIEPPLSKNPEAADIILDEIHSDLDRALAKAELLVHQVQLIEQQL